MSFFVPSDVSGGLYFLDGNRVKGEGEATFPVYEPRSGGLRYRDYGINQSIIDSGAVVAQCPIASPAVVDSAVSFLYWFHLLIIQDFTKSMNHFCPESNTGYHSFLGSLSSRSLPWMGHEDGVGESPSAPQGCWNHQSELMNHCLVHGFFTPASIAQITPETIVDGRVNDFSLEWYLLDNQQHTKWD